MKNIYTISILVIIIFISGGWYLLSDREQGVSTPFNLRELGQSKEGVYDHRNPNFSFEYPQGFEVNSLDDGLGETFLIREKINPSRGMQIFVSEFDEIGSLTPERIQKDLPGLVMKNVQQVELFENTPVLIFLDERDVVNTWFVKEGYLYQISVSQDLGEIFETVIESMRFQ